MEVPLRFDGHEGRTRDVSSKGVYFLAEAALEAGAPVEMDVTLTHASVQGPVTLHLRGRIIRVEEQAGASGVAAAIESWDVSDPPGLPALFCES